MKMRLNITKRNEVVIRGFVPVVWGEYHIVERVPALPTNPGEAETALREGIQGFLGKRAKVQAGAGIPGDAS